MKSITTIPTMSSDVAINIFRLSNYKFDTKEPIQRKDPSLPASLQRLKEEYDLIGLRQSVEAVILVHEHNLPHILLLQISPTLYMLPGGELELDEKESEALLRYLNYYLSPKDQTSIGWEIVDTIANWWRPNFEQHQYPYIPPHITKPKEHKRLFLIRLPENAYFSVPSNLKLVAVPLLEVYDNSKSYGHVISSLPQTLSRFNFNLL